MNMASEYNGLTSDAVPGAPRNKILSPIVLENDSKKTETNENKNINENKNALETVSTPSENTTRNTEFKSTNTKHSKERKSQPKKPKPPNTNIIVMNSSQVHFGPVNNYNYSANNSESGYSKSEDRGIPCTVEIRRVLSCEAKTTKEHCEIVAEHLGSPWRDIGFQLGYSNGQLDRFYEDNKSNGLKEVIYQMLLDWTQEQADKATLGCLATVLWDSQQKSVVQRLVKFV